MPSYVNLENVIVAIVVFLYMTVAISYALKCNWAWALVWFSYALANFGLTWAAMNSK